MLDKVLNPGSNSLEFVCWSTFLIHLSEQCKLHTSALSQYNPLEMRQLTLV